MFTAAAITWEHDRSLTCWHQTQSRADCGDPAASDVAAVAVAQHRANYELWHEEDKARSPEASDATITAVKHAIDRLNQQRNDLVEQIDTMLLAEAGQQNEGAPMNSESPGLIIDRLSILALKIYHTREESERNSATPGHRSRNTDRLRVLLAQRADLARCLDELWADVLAGRRRFHLYRQMKMYNDPELNPVIYARTVAAG